MNITFLGPAGASFSNIAYDRSAELFGAPRSDSPGVTVSLATANPEVIPLLLENGGYAVLAMETQAEGRIDPPINSFIQLVRKFDRNCPFQIIGALLMPINFALMVRPGVRLREITKIVTHEKSVGACAKNIKKLGVPTELKGSNGIAAQFVAHHEDYRFCAALAPKEAAEKYRLEILNLAFEDQPAVTTFYFLGPEEHPIPKTCDRILLVFRTAHSPGALVDVLLPFKQANINMRTIDSHYAGEGSYDFAIELECTTRQVDAMEIALDAVSRKVQRAIVFGPFPVVKG